MASEVEWSDEEVYKAFPLHLDIGNSNAYDNQKEHQSMQVSEKEHQSMQESEKEHQSMQESEKEHQSMQESEKEHQSMQESEKEHQSMQESEKEHQLMQESEKEHQSMQESETEHQSMQESEKEHQSMQESEKEHQSMQESEKEHQSMQESEKEHQSMQESEKEHQSMQESEKEHQSMQESETEHQSMQESEKVHQSMQESEKEHQSMQELEKEPQSMQESEKEHQSMQESSDDDVPLIEVQKKIQGQKRKGKRKVQAIDLSCFPDSDYSDLDTNYQPSSDSSSYSDDYQTPVIEKRKRKWMRKRIRPLKREQGRKKAIKKPRKLISGTATTNATEHQDSEIQEVLQRSKKETQLNRMLKQFAETRLTNLLSSNGLEKKHIKPDGNCFFNSIIHQIGTDMSSCELRAKLCNHLRENDKHYIGFISKTNAKDELQLSEQYTKLVEELGNDGIWNNEMSDVLPLAATNTLAKSITIYSSRLHSPIIHVTPDMGIDIQEKTQDIKIAYLIVSGMEHYDSCNQVNKENQQTTPSKNIQNDNKSCLTKTPTKFSNSSSSKCATPRKRAEYVSPKKVKQSRKKTPNSREWKKNIRKTNRNTGKEYISDKSKKVIEAKNVLPATCNNCKNKCIEKVSEESRQSIFRSYYDETMTFERKRDFICQHVDVRGTSKRYGRKRKLEARTYYLPVEKQRKQICKSFFLSTLNIGKKTIECSLKRKYHGSFDGIDRRGRHTPANKTDDETIKHIKTHIESFPAVESHYTRKLTSKKFLSQDLSIRKMYDLYKTKCDEDRMNSVSEKVYRDVFCKEYNFSFHKPKKDTCQTCNTNNEKKKNDSITELDETLYTDHIKRKEQARMEKDNDKKKFLESGHTHMECDSMHSAIEHAKKQTTLYVPEQWDTIFQMARRQNPYVVVPLRFDNFYDLKEFARNTYKNFKTTIDGETVNWLKVKVLKVQKSNPEQILVKYNFDDSDFFCINVKRGQRGRPKSSDKMPMKYRSKLPISVKKKNDLLDLCKALVIPEMYWTYYDNLLTNKTVKDTLPCADVLDDCNSDTDDEF